jgi:hypothetical protein
VRLEFFLPEPGDVVLEVYDVKGRLAGKITRTQLPGEWNTFVLTGGQSGIDLGRSGVYFYRLTSGPHLETGKFTVVR